MQHRVGQWITPPRSSRLKPEQRVVLLFFIVQNLSVMSKLRSQLELQQKMNRAVETLMNHFGKEVSLAAYYEEMASAQSQVMSVMLAAQELSHIRDCNEEVLKPKDVANFFSDINDLFQMLKPIDQVANME